MPPPTMMIFMVGWLVLVPSWGEGESELMMSLMSP